MPRVLVIGATGVLGSTVAAAFVKQGWQVLAGTRSPAGGADAVLVDLKKPDTVKDAMERADITVSTVPDVDMVAERTALERGGLLLNVATVEPEYMEGLRDVLPSAQGTVVLNCGLAPGVTNLLAADLLADHPETDTVEIVLTFSTNGMSGRAGVEFFHRNLTRSGKNDSSAGIHETRTIPLPKPFGQRTCLGFAEREHGWIESVSGGRRVETYACFDSRTAQMVFLAMNRARLLSVLPRAPFLAGKGSSPADPTEEPVAHWVSVGIGSKRVAAATVECRGDYLGTARAMTVFADNALGRRNSWHAGVFSSERMFRLDDMRAQLAEVGVEVVDQAAAIAANQAA